jgi:hypothetical protein
MKHADIHTVLLRVVDHGAHLPPPQLVSGAFLLQTSAMAGRPSKSPIKAPRRSCTSLWRLRILRQAQREGTQRFAIHEDVQRLYHQIHIPDLHVNLSRYVNDGLQRAGYGSTKR